MKEFFIHHTEKLVLGLCVALAGWFIYSSVFGMPRYDKTPDTFIQANQTAQQRVLNSPPKLDDLPTLDFQKDLEQLRAPIDVAKFPLVTKFIRPLELNYQFRGTPRVLRPEAPEVKINRGLILLQEGRDAKEKGNLRVFKDLLASNYPAELIWFLGNEKMPEFLEIITKAKDAAKAPPAAGRPADKPTTRKATDPTKEKRRLAKGMRWAEIVAPFPHANQIREFIETLKEGRNKAGVRYALAEVERREMVENRQWSPWKRIAWEKTFDTFDSAEKLDDPFESLPPRVVVPGLAMRVPDVARSGGDQGEPIRTSTSNIPDRFKSAKIPTWTPAEENPKAPATAPPPAVRPPAEEDDGPAPLDEPARRTGGNLGSTFDSYSDVETAMIRIHDYTIEPGKRYQYRVRAVLFNPNFNRPDVVDPSQALSTFLYGEFSEPSAEVYVEPDTTLFLADNKANARGRVDFSIFYWLADTGRWVRQTVPYFVGQTVGAGSQKPVLVPLYDPKTSKVTPKSQVLEKGFDTNMILLEVSRDQVRDTLPGIGDVNVRPPRRVVLVNEYGDLVRRTEVVDLSNPARQDQDAAIDASLSDKGNPKRSADRGEDRRGESEREEDDLSNPIN